MTKLFQAKFLALVIAIMFLSPFFLVAEDKKKPRKITLLNDEVLTFPPDTSDREIELYIYENHAYVLPTNGEYKFLLTYNPYQFSVELNNGKRIDFPEGKSLEEVQAYMDQNHPSKSQIQSEKNRKEKLKCIEKYSRNQKNNKLGSRIRSWCSNLINANNKSSKKTAKCALKHLSKSNNITNARAGITLCKDKSN